MSSAVFTAAAVRIRSKPPQHAPPFNREKVHKTSARVPLPDRVHRFFPGNPDIRHRLDQPVNEDPLFSRWGPNNRCARALISDCCRPENDDPGRLKPVAG
ncbi:hypothetical protein AVEN_265399-1 [Araneus ventricosus]|uniref:Uncharacterized protein n=1 Tax=Araneus ventricosus TaxID=182803 RepID=A0A4Y2HPY8_ARAVE|nr:hypothetical protein AVEN_265399-1 [Araneus ventricosus]